MNRDEAVADARQHGVTIQRLGGTLYDDFSAWSERQWLQWSGERVQEHCSEDAANARKRARGRRCVSCGLVAMLRARQQRSEAAGDAQRTRRQRPLDREGAARTAQRTPARRRKREDANDDR